MGGAKRTLEEMLGESLREAGVLMVVFYGLSVLVRVGGVALEEVLQALVALLAGAALWLIGAHEELEE